MSRFRPKLVLARFQQTYVCWRPPLPGSGSSFRRADGHCRQGIEAVGAVGKVWSRDRISQAGGVERKDDAPHSDSNPPTALGGARGAELDSSTLRELELLSNTSAAVSQPTNPPDHPTSANPASANKMSTKTIQWYIYLLPFFSVNHLFMA